MKQIAILSLFFLPFQSTFFAQSLLNFKVKNESNAKERTQMLDLLRNDIKKEINQDVIFVVEHFMCSGIYGWMEGSVQRKDGKPLSFPNDFYDCCHVEALFKRVNGSWTLKAQGAFSTDVWYNCLGSNYPNLDKRILSVNSRNLFFCD